MTLFEITGSLNVIGYGLAAIGPALGVAWIWSSVIQGTARQPEARGMMQSIAWVSFGLVEALALFGFALAFAR